MQEEAGVAPMQVAAVGHLAAEALPIQAEESLWATLVGQCMSQVAMVPGGRLLMWGLAQAFMQIQVVDLGQGHLTRVAAWVVRKHHAVAWGAPALRELATWLPLVIGLTWVRGRAVLHRLLHTSMLARALVVLRRRRL